MIHRFGIVTHHGPRQAVTRSRRSICGKATRRVAQMSLLKDHPHLNGTDVSAAWMVVTTPRYRISRNVGGEPLLLPSPSPMFGYKNHIGIDRAHGLIRTWDANAANANEPRPLANRPET